MRWPHYVIFHHSLMFCLSIKFCSGEICFYWSTNEQRNLSSEMWAHCPQLNGKQQPMCIVKNDHSEYTVYFYNFKSFICVELSLIQWLVWVCPAVSCLIGSSTAPVTWPGSTNHTVASYHRKFKTDHMFDWITWLIQSTPLSLFSPQLQHQMEWLSPLLQASL